MNKVNLHEIREVVQVGCLIFFIVLCIGSAMAQAGNQAAILVIMLAFALLWLLGVY